MSVEAEQCCPDCGWNARLEHGVYSCENCGWSFDGTGKRPSKLPSTGLLSDTDRLNWILKKDLLRDYVGKDKVAYGLTYGRTYIDQAILSDNGTNIPQKVRG